MKTVLSYGAGVNSTAIIALALLGKIDMPDYIVFSDTGAEHPYTYKYIDYLECSGIGLTYLTGGDKHMDLIQFCQEKNIMPSRLNRWCSDHWKITPVYKFSKSLGENTIILIGIDAKESHRANRKNTKNKKFPLIELGIDRNGCKKVIQQVGLGIPQKSGCFICPYQKKAEWIDLKKSHPNLWKIAIDLEKNSMKKSPNYTFIGGYSLDQYVSDLDKQEELPFGDVLDQRCECIFQ